MKKKVVRTSLVLAIGCLMLGSSLLSAGASPRRMNGTWLAVVEVTIPPGPTVELPELGTFATSGTVVMSTGFPPMTFPFDQGTFTAIVNLGQGNWTYRGGKFRGTQLRFVSELGTGMPKGYTKLISEWHLVDKKTAHGTYRAEILQPDMQPYTIGGQPVVFTGDFDMIRVPIESLP
jgi:hypothetical protein